MAEEHGYKTVRNSPFFCLQPSTQMIHRRAGKQRPPEYKSPGREIGSEGRKRGVPGAGAARVMIDVNLKK